MLERLHLDVALAGLLVIEVNKMVINQIRPDPTVATFVMQVGAYGALELTLAKRNHPNRFAGLRDYLLESYTSAHPAVLITCAHFEGMTDIVHPTTVGRLADDADIIHTGMSLYLPPAKPRVDTDAVTAMSRPQGIFFGE